MGRLLVEAMTACRKDGSIPLQGLPMQEAPPPALSAASPRSKKSVRKCRPPLSGSQAPRLRASPSSGSWSRTTRLMDRAGLVAMLRARVDFKIVAEAANTNEAIDALASGAVAGDPRPRLPTSQACRARPHP
jgi:hypothetical protein